MEEKINLKPRDLEYIAYLIVIAIMIYLVYNVWQYYNLAVYYKELYDGCKGYASLFGK